jgi:hypothetical protein
MRIIEPARCAEREQAFEHDQRVRARAQARDGIEPALGARVVEVGSCFVGYAAEMLVPAIGVGLHRRGALHADGVEQRIACRAIRLPEIGEGRAARLLGAADSLARVLATPGSIDRDDGQVARAGMIGHRSFEWQHTDAPEGDPAVAWWHDGVGSNASGKDARAESDDLTTPLGALAFLLRWQWSTNGAGLGKARHDEKSPVEAMWKP